MQLSVRAQCLLQSALGFSALHRVKQVEICLQYLSFLQSLTMTGLLILLARHRLHSAERAPFGSVASVQAISFEFASPGK